MNATTSYLETLAGGGEIEVTRLLECILQDAVVRGASDIHIEPWESSIAVRVRLDGVLVMLAHLPLEIQDRLSARCKVIAGIESYQSGLPQEGHVPASPERGPVDFRVSVLPAVRGEKLVIRLFDSTARRLELDSLGMEMETMSAFSQLLAHPSGMILLTGPTGSGKTTVMYSSILHITQRAGPTASISTVEDPVEVWLPMVTQSQINIARGFTYPLALRAILRQDPQVILIGEIRDAETAAIALQAGLTGHFVISTIHSGSGVGVFARMINMDIEPFLLASSITGVLSVRLVRRNCPDCSAPYEPATSLRSYVPEAWLSEADFRRGNGCRTCHETGFSGRVMVVELLAMTERLREAVLEKVPSRELQRVALEGGMRSLWHAGVRRAVLGETPLEEVSRVIPPDPR